MKLRIRGNSIRLRLTKSEVAQFAKTGLVEEAAEFGADLRSRFIYSLSSQAAGDDAGESPSAIFENNRITVLVPDSVAREWAEGNKVGVRGEQQIGDGKILSILIEKDYACLEDRPGEDDSDAYLRPPEGNLC